MSLMTQDPLARDRATVHHAVDISTDIYLYYLMTRDKTSNRPLLAAVSIAKKK